MAKEWTDSTEEEAWFQPKVTRTSPHSPCRLPQFLVICVNVESNGTCLVREKTSQLVKLIQI